MSPSLFPLLYVGTAVTYLLLAIPAGRLGDRIGRGRVFLLGHGLLLAACLALLRCRRQRPCWSAWLTLGLLGAYYACTDGVLMAAASACCRRSCARAASRSSPPPAVCRAWLSSLLFGARVERLGHRDGAAVVRRRRWPWPSRDGADLAAPGAPPPQ